MVLRVGLGTAAAHAGRGELGSVNVCPLALAGVLAGPVDGLCHLLVAGGSAIPGSPKGDDEDAPGRKLLEERAMAGDGVRAAGTVAPHDNGEALEVAKVFRVEEGMLRKRFVNIVCLRRFRLAVRDNGDCGTFQAHRGHLGHYGLGQGKRGSIGENALHGV